MVGCCGTSEAMLVLKVNVEILSLNLKKTYECENEDKFTYVIKRY